MWAFNDGQAEFHNYRNTVQRVKIVSEAHGAYAAQIGDFVGHGAVGSYVDDELSTDADFVRGERNLSFGIRVEFLSGPRFAVGSNGHKEELIPDMGDTWVCGTIEAILYGKKMYRIIHTKWGLDHSDGFTSSDVPFERVRRRIKRYPAF